MNVGIYLGKSNLKNIFYKTEKIILSGCLLRLKDRACQLRRG